MIRRFAFALLTVAAVLPVVPSHADGPRQSDVIVAMIDTGVYPYHEVFDYRGPNAPDDQFVAWWDFTEDSWPARAPLPGEMWDMRRPDPWDANGHGTATAALAVGRNLWWNDPSYAPGYRLAVAKVGSWRGNTGSIADAIRWAVDTVHASVINMSIGFSLPSPAANGSVYEALRYARHAGALVVVANGNGYLNDGMVPGEPGWASRFGSSTDVLTVGASGSDGLFQTMDPEVAARFTVYTACNWYEYCYTERSGTGISAPIVAGMAAAAMQTALENGHIMSVDWIERLLKYSARDTSMPPSFEGYGVLDDDSFRNKVIPGARAGRLPARPALDTNQAYVDGVDATLRDAWSNKVGREYIAAGPATTGDHQIGPSTAAVTEGEVYAITLKAGERIEVWMSTNSLSEDIDLKMYPAGPLNDARMVASSLSPAGFESMSYTSPMGGTYLIFVHGYRATEVVDFELGMYSWLSGFLQPHLLSQGTYVNTIPEG